MFHRTRLKVQESERLKLLNKKIEYEVKETTWDKEKKDLCGQIIELTESNVSTLPCENRMTDQSDGWQLTVRRIQLASNQFVAHEQWLLTDFLSQISRLSEQ